ncbi:autophagy protein 5 [Nowakowskiella sp. JEL0407]|nr:autophagy protein 5 [Nowakowskiella sp. JEL0407]
MSMMKEADHLKYGSTKKLMSLSKQDQLSLWESIISDNHDRFWEVNKPLILSDSLPKFIPLRIYIDNQPVIQDPVAPCDSTGRQLVLLDVLRLLIPENFPADVDDPTRLPKVIIHGIEPGLDVPFIWLSRNAIYSDGFLHIVIRLK